MYTYTENIRNLAEITTASGQVYMFVLESIEAIIPSRTDCDKSEVILKNGSRIEVNLSSKELIALISKCAAKGK
jgi:hypothetical protein